MTGNIHQLSSWSLMPEVFQYLSRHITPEHTVLELGSGDGTHRLASMCDRLYSVEHDENFLHRCTNTTYIHAPIVDGWYSREVLEVELAGLEYDFLIVDGPPGTIGRSGLLGNLDLFLDVPMLIDDVDRDEEMDMFSALAEHCKQDTGVFFVNGSRGFGVIGFPF